MDTAEGSSLQSALELQGAMLGRHEQELSSTRHSVDNLSAQFAGLVERLDRLTLSGFASAPSTVGPSPLSSEPRVNNPPTYAGEPKSCKSFLIQCEVVFSLQSRTYASETSKVAYVISLLTGRAREWGTAVWESQARCCFELESFKDEMIKTFDQSVFGKEASRLLASIQQGRRSVADYSVEFRTLAATSGWNAEALVARFLEGLNDAFKDELYAREVPDRLDDLISLALRLDARRELRRCARMRTEPVASTPLAPSSDESEPMQVDRLRLTAKEKQRRLLEGLCLYCAAQGHHAQSCPVKQSRPPQRVNMSGTVISSTHGSRTKLSVSIITKHASFKGSALIDSGAEGNFIDEEWARTRGILLQPLSSPIIAHGFDGRPLMRLSL
ncbi:Retrotransposon-derived PEG10 [Labeo rohita]|uniref:Retrotransposon-derived PEG10 n=1 Tax=Labeo rohita TaxID=84645 RepID=A0A498MZQ0_LABRO|nr:Retrotransposon-derived PEG10 [Labeo rohita]